MSGKGIPVAQVPGVRHWHGMNERYLGRPIGVRARERLRRRSTLGSHGNALPDFGLRFRR
jgi:hypothetical protein